MQPDIFDAWDLISSFDLKLANLRRFQTLKNIWQIDWFRGYCMIRKDFKREPKHLYVLIYISFCHRVHGTYMNIISSYVSSIFFLPKESSKPTAYDITNELWPFEAYQRQPSKLTHLAPSCHRCTGQHTTLGFRFVKNRLKIWNKYLNRKESEVWACWVHSFFVLF